MLVALPKKKVSTDMLFRSFSLALFLCESVQKGTGTTETNLDYI